MPLAEKLLIARIRRQALNGRAITAGIGDDCAILRIPRGHEALVTTDFSLEGVHFRREWHPSESIGHRCLARGLSDIAAMGGRPVAAFLSLALPAGLAQGWVDGFMHGLLALAERSGVTLAGGDTAESPDGVLADIVVLGSVPKGKALMRSGARPGDRIYVSGALGGSAAALRRLMEKPKHKLNPRAFPRHFFPEPRLRLGGILREKGLASAMIDLSDGLSTDLGHVCEESGVGAEVLAELVPLAGIGRREEVDLNTALHGGEDYELLFTARAGKTIPSHIAGVPIAEIGHITCERGAVLTDREGKSRKLIPAGWEHFRR